MERSPVKDLEIKALLKAALTNQVNDRSVYMKGIDASYHYEGYYTFPNGGSGSVAVICRSGNANGTAV